LPVRTFICWYRRRNGTPPDEVMSRYDVIVGAACSAERRDALRKLNPGIRFVVYVNAIDRRVPRGLADVERYDCGRRAPEHRNSPFQEDIWRNHRDFFLKNRGGVRGISDDPRVIYAWGYQRPYEATSRHANRFFLDPRSGWQDYYPDVCAATMKAGDYDGVFCDNAGPRIEWNFKNLPDDLKADITDAEWSHAVAAMLTKVSQRLRAERADALTFANSCGGFVREDTDDIEPAEFWRNAHIDGAMDEFFAYAKRRDGGDGYLPEGKWREQVRAILCCEKLGRSYFAQSNGDAHDHAARIYTLASFLIGAGDHARFNYNPAPAATYGLVYRFPEWDIDLGKPRVQYESLDEARTVGQGVVYAREFERGRVLVNPGTETVTLDAVPRSRRLTLEGGTITEDGRVVWESIDAPLTLPPHTGAIVRVD